jgi:hypothetical protein
MAIGAPRPPHLRPQNVTIVVSEKISGDSDARINILISLNQDAQAGIAI